MVSLIEKWRCGMPTPTPSGCGQSRPEPRHARSHSMQSPRIRECCNGRRGRRPSRWPRRPRSSPSRSRNLRSPAATLWRAVALFVQRSIDAWRHSLKAFDRCADGVGAFSAPTIVRAHSCDPWETARRNFPHVDDATGRLATRLLHEFGSPLLRRTRKPWDHVIALAVLRYAARLLRGELPECEPDCDGASRGRRRSHRCSRTPTRMGFRRCWLATPVPASQPRRRSACCAMHARCATRCAAAEAGGEDARRGLAASDRLPRLRGRRAGPPDAAGPAAGRCLRARRRGHPAGGGRQQTPNLVEMPRMLPDGASEPEIVRLYASACLPPNRCRPRPGSHAETASSPASERHRASTGSRTAWHRGPVRRTAIRHRRSVDDRHRPDRRRAGAAAWSATTAVARPAHRAGRAAHRGPASSVRAIRPTSATAARWPA